VAGHKTHCLSFQRGPRATRPRHLTLLSAVHQLSVSAVSKNRAWIMKWVQESACPRSTLQFEWRGIPLTTLYQTKHESLHPDRTTQFGILNNLPEHPESTVRLAGDLQLAWGPPISPSQSLAYADGGPKAPLPWGGDSRARFAVNHRHGFGAQRFTCCCPRRRAPK